MIKNHPLRIILLFFTVACLLLTTSCSAAVPEITPTATAIGVTASPTSLPPTLTATVTSTLTITPSVTPTVSQTPMPSPTLPATVEIEGIQGTHQTYELGCEANSAAQMARFFGVTVNEREFQAALPLTDNPDTGFVGQVEGLWGAVPPASYGVHAEPVMAELRNFGLNAKAHRQYSVAEIREEIAAGRPVMVWVIGGVRQGQASTYTAEDGSVITVAPFEHTVLVTGYGPDYFTFLDGKEVYHRSLAQFAESWQVLGNMAITMDVPHFLPEPQT